MVLATRGSVQAHKVNIFAYVEDDTVFTESYFNDGKKCIHSTVTVLDKQGTKLLEGKTDKDGLFSFPIPQYTDLRIVLTASMGHRAEYMLRKSEFSLTPIKKIIEKNQQDHGTSLTEVLGGIGYILGIMGLVIFFKNKKNK